MCPRALAVVLIAAFAISLGSVFYKLRLDRISVVLTFALLYFIGFINECLHFTAIKIRFNIVFLIWPSLPTLYVEITFTSILMEYSMPVTEVCYNQQLQLEAK